MQSFLSIFFATYGMVVAINIFSIICCVIYFYLKIKDQDFVKPEAYMRDDRLDFSRDIRQIVEFLARNPQYIEDKFKPFFRLYFFLRNSMILVFIAPIVVVLAVSLGTYIYSKI